jgi:hypothetical protein
MSTAFPHVNLAALKKFAAAAAAAEHPSIDNTRKLEKASPHITSCEDVVWGGEKVRTITQHVYFRAYDYSAFADDSHHFRKENSAPWTTFDVGTLSSRSTTTRHPSGGKSSTQIAHICLVGAYRSA